MELMGVCHIDRMCLHKLNIDVNIFRLETKHDKVIDMDFIPKKDELCGWCVQNDDSFSYCSYLFQRHRGIILFRTLKVPCEGMDKDRKVCPLWNQNKA